MPAIEALNLTKTYEIGNTSSYRTLRESLSLRGLAHRFRTRDHRTSTFRALDNVSFSIEQGETLGVIGRNGAGKSTLLKLFSRITAPSGGSITLSGRVGSLLEVGTGFNPELTGRENVYLNGAILGMQRREITAQFDDIVSFADVERFIDTPVKRYSSGMYMRLAFSVAAHLRADILIVDEVLAVGDAAFQKKCLGRMKEASSDGRTVLFVSHNMGAVMNLCTKALWLKAGRLEHFGATRDVISAYGKDGDSGSAEREIEARQHVRGTFEAQLERATLIGDEGDTRTSFLIREPLHLRLTITSHAPLLGTAWVFVTNQDGIQVGSAFQKDSSPPTVLESGCVISTSLAPFNLLPGRYSVSAGLISDTGLLLDWCEDIIHFEVLSHFEGGAPYDHRVGTTSPLLSWTSAPPVAVIT
jgi:lipopolysaccharide transport system ATP-binding protein